MEVVEWKFIPAHTPHMGGVWERLVRSVKRIFKALVSDKLLTDEELKPYLCEAEKIMIVRPPTTTRVRDTDTKSYSTAKKK